MVLDPNRDIMDDIDPCAGMPAGSRRQLRLRGTPGESENEHKEDKRDNRDREGKKYKENRRNKKDKADKREKEGKREKRDKRKKKKRKKDKGERKDRDKKGDKDGRGDKTLTEREHENGVTTRSRRRASVAQSERSKDKVGVQEEGSAEVNRGKAFFEDCEELTVEEVECDEISNIILDMEEDYEVSYDVIFREGSIRELLSNSESQKQAAMKFIVAFIRPADEKLQLSPDRDG